MAFNGSGTYVLPGSALVDGQTISATEHNTLRNDLATALTTCVTRDGQSPATANIPMGGFKFTGLAAGTGTGESARYDELNAHIVDTTDAHAASAITNTPAGGVSATTVQAAINELDTETVKLTGNQTVAGVKTFTSPVGVPAATASGDAVQKGQTHITSETPCFSAYSSSLQSVPNITLTKIVFAAEEFDTNSYYDKVTNYRFAPLVAGYYQITSAISYVSAAPNVLVSIYKGGSRFKDGFGQTIGGAYGNVAGVSALIYLDGTGVGTNGYVEIFGYQASGGALNVGNDSQNTYFQGVLVRAA